MPTISELRSRLDHVRALEADWKKRGSPEPEGMGIRAQLAAAEMSVASAISKPAGDWQVEPGSVHEILPAQAHASAVKRRGVKAQHKAPKAGHSKAELNAETDARFWAQTGYKPGQKLDPKNPTDRAMTKAWLDVFHKVEAEDAAGHLVTTYDHPDVAQHLADAAIAHKAAEVQIDAAAKTPDPWEQTQITEAAATANAMSQQSAKKAASYQPPTASPAVVETASHDAHKAAKQPPPGVIIYPKGHPVHWHPSARPAHTELATPNAPDDEAEPPQTPADQLALANAANAPKNAADVHAADAAAGGSDQIAPPSAAIRQPGSGPKKPMSTVVKVAIAAGGVLLVGGGITYAVVRSRRSRAPVFVMPSLPRPRASRARP